MTADGAVPADNPVPGSPVFTLGHRNVQGIVWHPSGALLTSEHGPSGELGLRAWDEINVIRPGANYGWPRAVGAVARPPYVDPIVAWRDSATPPSGMAFWHGELFVATLRSQALIRIRFEPDGGGWTVRAIERWFAKNRSEGVYGRLRYAVVGPDGLLYLLTALPRGPWFASWRASLWDGEWAILEWRAPLGLRGCGFFHVVHGKILSQRGYWDKLSFLRAQGLPLPAKP